MGSWEAPIRMREKLRYSTPSLPQALIKRLVIFGVPCPKLEDRAERSLLYSRGNGQWAATPVSYTQVYWARWDPPKGTEGDGRSAHRATFHHLPTVLDKQGGPCYWKSANWDPSTRRAELRVQGSRGLSACLMLGSGKVAEQMILRVIVWCMHNNRGTRSSHLGFVKGRSCLSNLTYSYNKMTCSVDEGKAVDVVCLVFSKAWDGCSSAFSRTERLLMAWMGVLFAEGWKTGWLSPGTMVNRATFSWQPQVVLPRAQYGEVLLNCFNNDLDKGIKCILRQHQGGQESWSAGG